MAFFDASFSLICLTAFTSVYGCGVLPSRQGRTVNFEVTGFELPPAMVNAVDRSAPSQVPNISTSEQEAVTFIKNVVMQSIEDVLYQQGRAAGLSSDVIVLILNQLDVTVKYEPLKCDIVFTNADGDGIVMDKVTNCQILDGTVTKTCTMPMAMALGGGGMKYKCMPMMLENIKPVHLMIPGIITTTNIIMANWSSQMWQIVLNRTLGSLTSGPLRSYFIGASITLK